MTILGSLINPCTYARAVELAASLGPRYLAYDKLGVAVFSVTEYEEAIANYLRKRTDCQKLQEKLE